ncbi:PTS IIA-like nitrogen regulatory protein PtsN [Acuticoccus sp. MNP-M23]|uniref:PTS IIA-like nitrogen regulatory protein PtsN n=1 Tax=Acuticoccus sp. MNP-M23 TaxID=3072793 RepID=UPI00281547C9|nr:PTS IIA-like nitrogen regulatory protein PtsN [Acuticoccus sp. MNP-M23]WMS42899.1 PTS IIA-like nitrogen regulatory protein PtsN [Acuticoccus sp. MNP-M23]
MDIGALISQDAVFIDVDVHSKKHAIQEVSVALAKRTGMPERAIFDTLLERERLGSTGVGHGVAIPHGKLADLDEIVGVFFRLKSAVGFDSLDDEPVDLIFALLAPEDAGADHLKALAKIARVLRAPGLADELRAATSRGDTHYYLTRTPVSAN